MGKIFGYYKKSDDGNDLDRCWYDSSNIFYSECLDRENEKKQLKVVFKNGSQYVYKDVNVSDYLLMREDVSTGKGLNKYVKGRGYEYERIEDANIAILEEELNLRNRYGYFISYDDETNNITVTTNTEEVVCVMNMVSIVTENDILQVADLVKSLTGKEAHVNYGK